MILFYFLFLFLKRKENHFISGLHVVHPRGCFFFWVAKSLMVKIMSIVGFRLATFDVERLKLTYFYYVRALLVKFSIDNDLHSYFENM